jgi:hypothetical protein
MKNRFLTLGAMLLGTLDVVGQMTITNLVNARRRRSKRVRKYSKDGNSEDNVRGGRASFI